MVKGLLDIWARLFTESLLKFPLPDLVGRLWIITDAAENLEEMPVPLELPIVILVLGL